MDIKLIPTQDIIPYEKNPRKNLNVDKVAISISEFGFQQPIVVDRNMVIIAGHTRWEASKKLGLEKVPVLIADLDPVKAKAYRIADNKTNEGSQWDMNLLNLEFTDLLDINYNLENLGFDTKELESIIVDKESFEPTSVDDQGAIDKDTKVICKDCGKRLYE